MDRILDFPVAPPCTVAVVKTPGALELREAWGSCMPGVS